MTKLSSNDHSVLAKLVVWSQCPKECVDAYRDALDFIEAQEWAGYAVDAGEHVPVCLDCGAQKGQSHSTDCWWLSLMVASGRRS